MNPEVEIWKPIKGYEELYEISSMGRVKSLKPRRRDKIILQPIKDYFGYMVIYLYKDKARIRCKIHRLVAKAFILNKDNKPQVNHIDGNKQNNCVSNLEWVSSRENILHATRTGLAGGHKHNTSKLTEDDVLFIRNKFKSKDKEFGAVALAKRFGIARTNIYKILRGDVYKLDGGKIITRSVVNE